VAERSTISIGSRVARGAPLLPFATYVVLFLIVPTASVVVGAFEKSSGGFTLDNVRTATTGVYRHGLITSLELAAVTSIVPAIGGTLLASAILSSGRTGLRRAVLSVSGTFANFGGVPLAFLFIATLGTTGVATKWLQAIGLDPYHHGFSLYTFSGVALVYMYFQVPLMVLVITPALDGMQATWREAADSLGATSWQYWRRVGIPILMPSFLGGLLLLFGSGLSAYATAAALTSGSIPLTPIQIGAFLSGNVISGQENVGKALGFLLIAIVAPTMAVYAVLQRKASRWLQ